MRFHAKQVGRFFDSGDMEFAETIPRASPLDARRFGSSSLPFEAGLGKFDRTRFGPGKLREILYNFPPLRCGRCMLYSQMLVEIHNACTVLLAHKHSILVKEAKHIFAVISSDDS